MIYLNELDLDRILLCPIEQYSPWKSFPMKIMYQDDNKKLLPVNLCIETPFLDPDVKQAIDKGGISHIIWISQDCYSILQCQYQQ